MSITWSTGTKRNVASLSTNFLMSQGQATRSTLTCSRVISFIVWVLLTKADLFLKLLYRYTPGLPMVGTESRNSNLAQSSFSPVSPRTWKECGSSFHQGAYPEHSDLSLSHTLK